MNWQRVVRATAWFTVILFLADTAGAGLLWRRCCRPHHCQPQCCPPPCCAPVVCCEPVVVAATTYAPTVTLGVAAPDCGCGVVGPIGEPAASSDAPAEEPIPTPAEPEPAAEVEPATPPDVNEAPAEAIAADEPPQPEPAEPLGTAADDVAPADAVMPATSEQESTTASTEPADDAPEPIAAADMFAEEGAPLADAPEDEPDVPAWSPSRPEPVTEVEPAAPERTPRRYEPFEAFEMPTANAPVEESNSSVGGSRYAPQPMASDDAGAPAVDSAAAVPSAAPPAATLSPEPEADADEPLDDPFGSAERSFPVVPSRDQDPDAPREPAAAPDDAAPGEVDADDLFGRVEAEAVLQDDGGFASHRARRWTAPATNRRWDARLVTVTADTAVFRQPNGMQTRCQLSDLSTPDLQFVQQQIAARQWQLAHAQQPSDEPGSPTLATR